MPHSKGDFEDDRQESLRKICQKDDDTIVSQLLKLQLLFPNKKRSYTWALKLSCLRVIHVPPEGVPAVLHRVSMMPHEPGNPYVAISYRAKPKSGEDISFGRYLVDRGDGQEVSSKVRNVVLDRVMKYLRYCRIWTFWIDADCIEKESKEEAIAEMDMVYRRCQRSVGLLSCILNKQSQVIWLEELLKGTFIRPNSAAGKVWLIPNIDPNVIQNVWNLILLITGDEWWTRCWTFQEEYCASTRMRLLIPYRGPPLEQQSYTKVASFQAELCIDAIDFRKATTLFCLAVSRDSRCRRVISHNQIRVVLNRAQNYQTLNMYHNHGRNGSRPMTAYIFDETCSRGLENLSDLPSIVANCCGYPLRFCKGGATSKSVSVSLVLLALFICNGEILDYQARSRDPLSKPIAGFLRLQSLDNFALPVASQELTFMKRCRLRDVELAPEGIISRGTIWKVDRMMTLPKTPSSCHFDKWKHHHFLNRFQRARLNQLAMALKDTDTYLSENLERFLWHDPDTTRDRSRRISTLQTNAKKLCQAIKKGKGLLLGSPENGTLYSAVFIASRERRSFPAFVFTSWKGRVKCASTRTTHSIEKYMSLEVKLVASVNGELRWVPILWVNGLCFFNSRMSQRVTFSWPSYLQ
jgi:hypothetical protein